LWVRIPLMVRCTRFINIICDRVCQWLTTGPWFSPDTPDSSTNKTDHHDIVEIFLIVVLNNYIIAITRKMMRCFITPNFSKNILGNICKILTTGILQIHVLKSKLPLVVNATELLGWYLMSNELNVDLFGYWYFKFNWQKLL
jgi:hypothetical protein